MGQLKIGVAQALLFTLSREGHVESVELGKHLDANSVTR